MPAPSGGPPPPRRRHVAESIIMVICGIVLLAPGLCALVFTGAVFSAGSGLIALWVICLLIGAAGLALIVKAFR